MANGNEGYKRFCKLVVMILLRQKAGDQMRTDAVGMALDALWKHP